MRNLFLAIPVLVSAVCSFNVQASGIKVLSAVVKDQSISDAQVIWQRNGESSQ